MKKYQEFEAWKKGDATATYYEDNLKSARGVSKTREKLMAVIHPEDMPWEECCQGKIKHMTNDQMDVIAKTVNTYIQEIPAGSKSGKHRHMAEEVVIVLEGRGYDLHWDVDMELTHRYEWVADKEPKRFDWEAGDIVVIPVNTVHQHFNADPDHPARIISAVNTVYKLLDYDDLEQIEPAPEYSPNKG
ncbi:cupin domain-containing protein [Candidatus Formimonas warabiya]|uniref:Uncharacterized protein n=1 Tax=Formimonas warabiya TaxID=1761012 RepID=A0A3G1KYN1_FORW1|nr:cupin domain-containing protein [Candidatus Formimonas warabiya]ATW27596.1 hypothetical protein DCMF_25110 [Candidatus Formimonas warabiya]